MGRPVRIRLHVVTPLHIGCGEVYEPTSFVIDQKAKKLIAFDPLDFIKKLSSDERTRLADICTHGDMASIIWVYKFISSFAHRIEGRTVDITQDFIEHYNKVKSMPLHDRKRIKNALANFQIQRTAFNPFSGEPYIPGTSVKGALRTAYLNKLANDDKVVRYWEKVLPPEVFRKGERNLYSVIKNGREKVHMKLERHLLKGSFATDPFRMVKVSDFYPLRDVRTRIVYAVNRRKPSSGTTSSSNLHQIVEVVLPGSVFEGTISIERPQEGSKISRPVSWTTSADTVEYEPSIKKALTHFYRQLVNNEHMVLREMKVDFSVERDINSKFKPLIWNRALPVRIGLHSGAEAVTIDGNRMIWIKGRGRLKDSATTIWLASDNKNPSSNSGLVPFGWTVLEEVK